MLFYEATLEMPDPKISSLHSATFREFILLPRKTEPRCALTEVSLRTRLAEGFPLAIPFMSAAMESVTGRDLAVALALEGGIGVLPAGKVEADEQLRQVQEVKAYRGGAHRHYLAVLADTPLHEVDRLEEQFGFRVFPVLDGEGRLLGGLFTQDYDPRSGGVASDAMRPASALAVLASSTPWPDIVEMLLKDGRERAFLLNEDGLMEGLVVRSGIKKELRYAEATRDAEGRLKVAVAISTHPEDQERAKECVAAGADLVSVDASDGFSSYMADTVRFVKELGVPVVAGNVVDRAGFEFLAECGADAVKVGIGSGSICTTRRVKAIGRGQATAVREVAMARDEWAGKTGRYLPVVSDGGLSGTGDMSVALCMGADVLMMGKYFAAFQESPTTPYQKKFQVVGGGEISATVKPYWGEASARAKNVRRYQQNDPRTFVIEGEEGYVLGKGSLHDSLPRDIKAIKGTLSSCGCANLQEFQRDVLLERQSVGSQQEGGTSILQG